MKNNIIKFILISAIFAQSEQPYPPLELVSIPTAGTLPRGTYTWETMLSKSGTIMPRLAIGLTSSLSLGISWGMNGLIGDEKPVFNMQPGFYVKYRAFDESNTRPAFLLGINTQGRGQYKERTEFNIIKPNLVESISTEYKRYEKKALGLFISLSKNWNFFGNLGFHLGANKNIWEKTGIPDDDEQINLFFGMDKEINRSFSLILEFDAALNDNQEEYEIEDLAFGRGKGFINAGLRWAMAPNILVEINFNDLRRNSNASYVNREIKIMYSESF